jgi:undecaprenyl-diphosphatase
MDRGDVKADVSQGATPAQYLGIRLVLGLAVAFVAGLLFERIAAQVSAEPAVLAADALALEVALAWHSPAVTWVMIAASIVGTKWVLFPLAIVVALTLAGAGARRRLLAFAASLIGGSLLAMLLKLHFQRPRPSEFEPIVSADGYSFPSGHATDAMLFFGGLAYVIFTSLEWSLVARLTGVALCAAAILLIGASRIYLGVHYLSDVVAGYALGLAWVAISTSAISGWARWRGRRAAAGGRA